MFGENMISIVAYAVEARAIGLRFFVACFFY